MADIGIDNPTFEPDIAEGPEEETSFIDPLDDGGLWETTTDIPSWAGGEEVPTGLQKEELATREQTRALVERWQREVSKQGLQADLEFRSSTRGDLWVKWGGRWLLLTWKNRPSQFLSPGTLERHGIQFSRALGVASEKQTLPAGAVTALQSASNELGGVAAAVDSVELQDLGQTAQKASDVVADAEIDKILSSMDDPPLNLRELRGLNKVMQTTRGELTNNLARLSELDDHIALEKQKLDQVSSEPSEEFARRRIAERLRNLQDERAVRLEAASTNREALRSQISRIRETINKVLNEDTTLAERIRTLFREQGITMASILTAIGMAISTLVLALTGRSVPAPAPPSDKGGLKDWVKKHLQSLGRALAKLAGKAAAALPGIIGSLVSWLLNLLAKTAGWLAKNLWAVALAVGSLLLIAAREWLSK